MKINYKLDNQNRIIGWSSFPLFDHLPIIEIDDPDKIILNFDMIINGEYITQQEEYYNQKTREERINELNNQVDYFKTKLQESDYHLYKFIEGYYTAEEYEKYRVQRKAWREEINRLEDILSTI